MKSLKRKTRYSEVKQTGRIPVGTDVHHRHLRNPSISYLHRVISQTEQMILSGECHADWGGKRIQALEKMLDSKEKKLEKKKNKKNNRQPEIGMYMESIKWDELEHAYGEASDIPQLLEQLESYPSFESYDEEPFYTLWSSLCHQGDIYSASYSAVPIIVSLIESAPDKVSYNYFLLPVCIEVARLKGNGPKLGKDIETHYGNSIKALANLTGKVESTDETMASVLAAATAVRHGKAELAEAILELTPDILVEFQEWLQER